MWVENVDFSCKTGHYLVSHIFFAIMDTDNGDLKEPEGIEMFEDFYYKVSLGY